MEKRNEQESYTMEDAQRLAKEALGIFDELPTFIQRFKNLWKMIVSDEAPDARQITTWWNLHRDDLMNLLEALQETSHKAAAMESRGEVFTKDHSIRFFSSVSNSIKTKKGNKDKNMTQTQETPERTAEMPIRSEGNSETLSKYEGRPVTMGRQQAEQTIAVDERTGALTPSSEVK